jgi:hypothetical protein
MLHTITSQINIASGRTLVTLHAARMRNITSQKKEFDQKGNLFFIDSFSPRIQGYICNEEHTTSKRKNGQNNQQQGFAGGHPPNY